VSILAAAKGEDGTVLGSLAVNKSEAGWLVPTSFRFIAAAAKSTLVFEDTTAQPLNVDLALDAVTVQPISPELTISVRSVNICWDTVPGMTYQLQKQAPSGVWMNVGNAITGDGKQVCIEQPVEGAVGFYRLTEVP
jgi:hypothetical protein